MTKLKLKCMCHLSFYQAKAPDTHVPLHLKKKVKTKSSKRCI